MYNLRHLNFMASLFFPVIQFKVKKFSWKITSEIDNVYKKPQ